MSTETRNYTAVDPQKGRTAAAAARVAAAEAEALRARPRAGARARVRRSVATTADVAPSRPADTEGERGERGRPSPLDYQPPTLRDLIEEAVAGPVLRDGEEEWHPAHLFAWRVRAWAAVLVWAALLTVGWVVRGWPRILLAAAVAGAVWLLATAGGDSEPLPVDPAAVTEPAPASPVAVGMGRGVSSGVGR